jgi:glycosyltransferase involved in cell wall biosynthesis
VDIPKVLSTAEPTMTIGFIGSFAYEPNGDAAEELITRIWPQVRARLPQAALVLAGPRPERVPSFNRMQGNGRDAGIEFTGLLSNVDHFYESVQLVCCPIRSGSGTRIKIIEAAAHGIPVAATRMAAEGLNFVDGVEIVLTDSPGSISQACIELLSDPVCCREIGLAARAKAMSHCQSHHVASSSAHLRSFTQD